MKSHKKCGFRTEFTALNYASRVFEAIDTPVSLACFLLAKYGEFGQLVTKSIDPRHYCDPRTFFLDYQAVKLLSKHADLPTGLDPRKAAMEKFIEFEILCSSTNTRFYSGTRHPNPSVERIMFNARRKISDCLGDVPTWADLNFRFGPGASFGVRGETSVYNKVTSTLECTFAMLSHVGSFLKEFPGLAEHSRSYASSMIVSSDAGFVRPVLGSELDFVPKDAKTLRPICIEPTLNGLYQKGVGSYMKNRLRSWGINLRDQSINQKMAARAFVDNLSTVDFSSASDSIAHGLVLELLPLDWVEFLAVARSPRYLVEGRWYEFEKFSSMGNAYTFELESLIFFALASATCDELGIFTRTGWNLSVYGDDVIIPRDAFDLFVEVSNHCGFKVNRLKSYKSGEFFESCGHDYFQGHYVRPFFLRGDVVSTRDLFHVTNQVLSIIETLEALPCPLSGDSRVSMRLHTVHAWCIARIPRADRYLVPYGAGDGGLHADFDAACPALADEGWCGYKYRQFSELPVKLVSEVGVVIELDPEKDPAACVKESRTMVPHPLWPISYATYYAGLSPRWLWRGEDRDLPVDQIHSDGYTVRGRTKLRRTWNIWFGHWPRLPVQWSERSLRLIEPPADYPTLPYQPTDGGKSSESNGRRSLRSELKSSRRVQERSRRTRPHDGRRSGR